MRARFTPVNWPSGATGDDAGGGVASAPSGVADGLGLVLAADGLDFAAFENMAASKPYTRKTCHERIPRPRGLQPPAPTPHATHEHTRTLLPVCVALTILALVPGEKAFTFTPEPCVGMRTACTRVCSLLQARAQPSCTAREQHTQPRPNNRHTWSSTMRPVPGKGGGSRVGTTRIRRVVAAQCVASRDFAPCLSPPKLARI